MSNITDFEQLPCLMTAKDIQRLGFSRSISYQLLKRQDMPTICIGKKLFVQKDNFLQWLESQHKGGATNDNNNY